MNIFGNYNLNQNEGSMSIHRKLTKDGKLIYIDTITGERFDYDPQALLKKLSGGQFQHQ